MCKAKTRGKAKQARQPRPTRGASGWGAQNVPVVGPEADRVWSWSERLTASMSCLWQNVDVCRQPERPLLQAGQFVLDVQPAITDCQWCTEEFQVPTVPPTRFSKNDTVVMCMGGPGWHLFLRQGLGKAMHTKRLWFLADQWSKSWHSDFFLL